VTGPASAIRKNSGLESVPQPRYAASGTASIQS
jgi:hypothetical protein